MENTRTSPIPSLTKNGKSTELFVLLHGYSKGPETLNGVTAVVHATHPDADILCPQLALDHRSGKDLNGITRDVLTLIDKAWQIRRTEEEPEGYQHLFLIGHSCGSLVTRKVYIVACGNCSEAPLEKSFRYEAPREWACAVKRVILLAGMNRGWRISYHLSPTKAIALTVGSWLGALWEFVRQKPLPIFQARRGAPFLTQLRLQWLAMRRHAARKSCGHALTVQLLGSIDDLVSPDDNIDLIAGQDFVYLDVPWSGHMSVLDMLPDPQAKDPERNAKFANDRAQVFANALMEDEADLRKLSVILSEQPENPEDRKVKQVIFLVHGIRDEGYWTQKIGRRIKRAAEKHGKGPIALETASYGYFPMAPFLLAAKRREKVEWLMDQYASVMARYPNAEEFSVVAHSNGTYLVAKALEQYSGCRFAQVAFAGSVVQSNYPWERLLKTGRVKRVLNYVATADWVVAWFPKLFQFLPIQDLGGAGHDGFSLARVPGTEVWERVETRYQDNRFYEVHCVEGGHGAALEEENWDALAEFVVTGKPAGSPKISRERQPIWWVRWPGYFPPMVWALILVVLFLLGSGATAGAAWLAEKVAMRVHPGAVQTAAASVSAATVALLGYLWLIWQILTRL